MTCSPSEMPYAWPHCAASHTDDTAALPAPGRPAYCAALTLAAAARRQYCRASVSRLLPGSDRRRTNDALGPA